MVLFMQEQNVAIKGIKDGLLIALSPTEEWLAITTDLAARIDQQSAFFAGARITVDLGQRPVPKHELSSLKALLERIVTVGSFEREYNHG